MSSPPESEDERDAARRARIRPQDVSPIGCGGYDGGGMDYVRIRPPRRLSPRRRRRPPPLRLDRNPGSGLDGADNH